MITMGSRNIAQKRLEGNFWINGLSRADQIDRGTELTREIAA